MNSVYKEIVHTRSFAETEAILLRYSDDQIFSDKELRSVEYKNRIKSLGARYLIKKSILDFLELGNDFRDIEIENEESGKPKVLYKGVVKKKLEEMNIANIKVSISHSRNFVSTLVVIE